MFTNSSRRHISGQDLTVNYLKILNNSKIKSNFVSSKIIKFNEVDNTDDNANECANFMSLYNTSRKLNSPRSKHKLFSLNADRIYSRSSDDTMKRNESKSFEWSNSPSPQVIFKKRFLSPISPKSKRRLCSSQSSSFMEENIFDCWEQNTKLCDKLSKSLSYNKIDTLLNTSNDLISYNCVNQYKDIFSKLKKLNNKKIKFKHSTTSGSNSNQSNLNINKSQDRSIDMKFKKNSAFEKHISIHDCTKTKQWDIQVGDSNSQFASCSNYSIKIILLKNNIEISNDFKSDSANLNNFINGDENGRQSPIIPFYNSKFLKSSNFSKDFEKSFKISN